ncbi:thiol-disulfide oxidoreductase [Pedobacter yonginense]|uniref:Thiol-disulfide oxidoreductase n=1 Tax=Pedobacter yonginense TaxID=651869 RepID=A0A317EGX9_9SPHI|nr:DCC1-like thiol-disulfide oxidoreductase family protein [Pedobacter yonginense]PWS26070.1 thiol-disulfide oxidoreductase [Pedobacter yonginense]
MAQPIIFFDGVCNLCNASVQFVIKHDKDSLFKFTALQSVYAQELLSKFNVDPSKLNSTMLLEDGVLYTKSSAALRVARKLDGLCPMLFGFMLVPRFIRDWVYDLIAKNRYRWWGKQEQCWVPTPDLKLRFLS